MRNIKIVLNLNLGLFFIFVGKNKDHASNKAPILYHHCVSDLLDSTQHSQFDLWLDVLPQWQHTFVSLLQSKLFAFLPTQLVTNNGGRKNVSIQNIHTVVANMTFSSVKPSISTSNVALKANPGTVMKSACPEDSKTPPTCYNWLSFDWDNKDQKQMVWF